MIDIGWAFMAYEKVATHFFASSKYFFLISLLDAVLGTPRVA
jgi:hypothetical protein